MRVCRAALLVVVLHVPVAVPFGRLRELKASHLEGTPCLDSNKDCERFSAAGECEKNPHYMGSKCSKSCGLCDGTADRRATELEAKELAAQAALRAKYAGCKDEHHSCKKWARDGECDNNPTFMRS